MKRRVPDSLMSWDWSMHLAGAALLLSIVAGYYFGVYGWLHEQVAEDAEQIERLTSNLQEAVEVRNNHHRLEQQYESLRKKVDTVHGRLTWPMDQEQLSRDLRQVALASGLKVTNLDVAQPENLKKYRRIEIALTCTGSYASTCDFVDGLGRLLWFADITQLRIKAKDGRSDYSVLAKFSVYYDPTPTVSDKI